MYEANLTVHFKNYNRIMLRTTFKENWEDMCTIVDLVDIKRLYLKGRGWQLEGKVLVSREGGS